VSTQEAVLLRLRDKALKGDSRSFDRLIGLAQTYNNGALIESVGAEAVMAEDQALLDAYVAQARSSMREGADDDSEPNVAG
jgi:hypothetical protein